MTRVRWFVAVWLVLGAVRLSAEVDLPPQPADYLLDQAAVFPPEVSQRITKALKACARDYDVHIYVLTVPTLKVMPSRLQEKLAEMLNATRTKWLEDRVGAVIIFEDEAGTATMGASAEASKVFSPVAISLIFRDPQLHGNKKTRSPERLAEAVAVLIRHFTDLRDKANQEGRRRRAIDVLLWAILGGTLLLGAGVLFVRRQSRHHLGAIQ